MAETRTYGGFSYVQQPDGTWRRGASTQPQMPANPAFPYQGPQAAANVQNAQANAAGQAIQNRVDAASSAADIRKRNAEAAKAELDTQAAAADAASKPSPEAAKQIKGLQLDEVLKAIDNARGEISGFSTGIGGQILQPIGGTQARDLAGDLSTIGSALTVDKLMQMKSSSSTGASGMGALSEKEGQLLRDSVSSLDQARSSRKVKDSLDAIELHYRRLRAIQDGQDPDKEDVQRAYGIVTPNLKAPVVGGGSQGGGGIGPRGNPLDQNGPNGGGTQLSLAQGDYKLIQDPLRKGVNDHVQTMVKQGASAADISGYLAGIGINPATVKGIEDAVQFRQQYPSYTGTYPVDVETKAVPLGVVGGAINKVGQSGVGAYFTNAADALTAGTLDNMTSNPGAARAAMDAISNQHPYASIGGTLTGGALAAGGLETGLGALGLKAIPAAMAADATYGGAYGAGTSDTGSRLSGALGGSLIGVGGGMFGRALAKGAGGLVRGVSDPAKKLLNDAGVRMTVPQMAGGTLKAAEDRLAGLPGVGSIVNGGRRRSLQDWRQAAFNEGLAPIGQQAVGNTGEQAIQNAQDAVSQAYQGALGGVRVTADTPFKQSMAGLAQQVGSIPRVGPELGASMSTAAGPMFGPGGTLTGESAQDILQGMEGIKRSYRGNAFTPADPLYATHIAPAVDTYTGAINNLLDRQAPGVTEGLRAANSANRNVSILGDAVLAAQGRSNGDFTPAQLMQAIKANTKAFSGKRAAAAGRGGMFGFARAGNQVLPETVPDSGTAGRLALYGLLGGGYGLGDYTSQREDSRSVGNSATKAIAAASALALASKGARPIVQKMAFAGRSPNTEAIGQWIYEHPQFLSGAGIPLLVSQR